MSELKSKRQMLADLWKRHVPDKNLYETLESGRRSVVRRVFQRRDAPEWAFYDCCWCTSPMAVCYNHQFVLYGHDGVRRYIEDRNGFHQALRQGNVSSSSTEVLKDILTEYLNLTSPEVMDLLCTETACRVDVMDECDAAFRSLWSEFRAKRGNIFHRDTGVYLPMCCRFPQSNLYIAFREAHKGA